MSRKLDDLSPRMMPVAMQLLARLVEAGIMVLIVDTRRTLDEQKANVAKGVSWTLNSRHLVGDAIDICPFDQWQLHGPDKLKWDPKHPVWQEIGAIGQQLGLKWGVIKGGERIDLGHFEFRENGPP